MKEWQKIRKIENRSLYSEHASIQIVYINFYYKARSLTTTAATVMVVVAAAAMCTYGFSKNAIIFKQYQ